MSLHDEIKALSRSSGVGDQRFPTLERLARQASRRVPAGNHSPSDLVQAFWLSQLETASRTGTEPFQPLLTLEAGDLQALVRNRLRELAVEAAPNWNRVRALRAMVRRALSHLPPAPQDRPGVIARGPAQHFSQELVRLAVAWVLDQSNPPEPKVRDVSRGLMRLYLPHEEIPVDAHHVHGDPLDEIRRDLDGETVAELLLEALAPEQLDILIRRYRGETFEEIARATGIAAATCHARFRRALDDAQSYLEEVGLITLGTASRAFQRLISLRGPD